MNEEDIHPGDLYWQAIEPIWDAINIYDGPTLFLQQFRSVKPHLRHLFATHWCQSEVCNGGFEQFFWNSTGVLAPEAVEGFLALGLDECAAILKEAMGFFGTTYPRDRSKRTDMLDRLPKEATEDGKLFKEVDDRFFDAIGPSSERFCHAADEFTRSAAS